MDKDSKIINNILLLDLKLDKDRPTKVCNICNREYNQKANNQIWCGKCYYIKKCKNCNHNMLTNRDLKVCSRSCNVKNNWKDGVYKNHLSLIKNYRNLNNISFVTHKKDALKIISEENIKNLPYRIISSFEEYLEIIKTDPEYGFVRLLNEGNNLIYSAQTNAKDYEKSIVKQIFNKTRKAEYMKYNIDSMKIIWGFNSDKERLAVEGYYDSFARISVQNKSI